MATYQSDLIDEASNYVHGHTNWAYWSTLSDDEKTKALANKDNVVVVFYDEEACYECDCSVSECECSEVDDV